jgi:hypothetical protein
MIPKRRAVLAGILAVSVLPFFCRTASTQLFVDVPYGDAPGDFGYKHKRYHPYYQALFGKLGHCACGTGECRVTDWRMTILNSPIGFDVIVERNWWPLPGNVWMPKAGDPIPPELFKERAHVCAYGRGAEIIISCALINMTGS